MADVYGSVLVPIDTNNETLLYTCPIVEGDIDHTAEGIITYAQQPITQTTVTALNVCGITQATTFDLYITPGTIAPTTLGTVNDYALAVNVTGYGSTNRVFPGIVLAPGNTLWFWQRLTVAAPPSGPTVSIFYIEHS